MAGKFKVQTRNSFAIQHDIQRNFCALHKGHAIENSQTASSPIAISGKMRYLHSIKALRQHIGSDRRRIVAANAAETNQAIIRTTRRFPSFFKNTLRVLQISMPPGCRVNCQGPSGHGWRSATQLGKHLHDAANCEKIATDQHYRPFQPVRTLKMQQQCIARKHRP